MDIRQAATDEGQDSGYGKAQQRHTEGDPTSSLGSDQRDMWRMGKAQELRRYFGPWATVGFSSVLGCAWQYVCLTLIWSLPNGGPTGAVYMYLTCCVGLMLTSLSLAEMASMAPSAGGQYHWISELAPRNVQKLLSYTVGWLTVLGWQVGLASVSYAAALQIQSLVVLVNPGVSILGWHTAFITIAIALIAVGFNTILISKLPTFEFIVLVAHIAAYFAFAVVLLFMGPQSSRAEVFNNWQNENEWPNLSVAVLVGIIAPVTSLTSADSICHLAEELEDAARWLPRCLVGAAAFNFSASFIMLIVILFRAGDIAVAIDSPTGQPYIAILLNATQSTAGTAVMVAYIIFALIFCATNMVTTSSRQLFSFARDNGLPYSAWLAKVSPERRIPTNAIICTACFTLILSAILAGSPLAFNIIASLGAAAILGSYMISIGTITYRRLRGFKLLKTQFSLGRFALPINIMALVFVTFAWVLAFFPAAPQPTAESMNWSSLIFGVVLVGSLILYFAKKRHEYHGPVASVRETEEVDQAIDLDNWKT